MFGLGEQLQGNDVGLRGIIGQNEDLRWTGRAIDSDLSTELLLGFRYVGVAWTDDFVYARDAFCAQRERRDGTRASHRKEPVGAGQRACGLHYGWRESIRPRW